MTSSVTQVTMHRHIRVTRARVTGGKGICVTCVTRQRVANTDGEEGGCGASGAAAEGRREFRSRAGNVPDVELTIPA
jgi:hypothetical protein